MRLTYTVDPKTLLFYDLGHPEFGALRNLCEGIVMKGLVDLGHPAYKAWLAAYLEFSPSTDPASTSLMLYSTVFPQRALLSCLQVLKGGKS